MFKKEFANIISQTGLLTLKDLKPFYNVKSPYTIGEFELLKLPGFDDNKLAQILSKKFKLPFLDLSSVKVEEDLLSLVPRAEILRLRCVPIRKNEKGIVFATFDPTVLGRKKDLQKLVGADINIILTTISAWQHIFNLVPVQVKELLNSIEELGQQQEVEATVNEADIGTEVVDYVYRVLAEAFAIKASDIHFEPYEERFRVRFRVDGNLTEYDSPSMNLMLPVLSRIKIMAQLDISERRKPQDGRIKLRIIGRDIDYRVSSLPTLFGEKIVLRLLDKSNLQLDMKKLGFEHKQLKVFQDAIYKPYGMCLVTGPTGSGKTTTLYSALSELNKEGSNISTAEDPVEFNLMGINQVNVRKDIGFDFARSLKAFLRQDPDIIMVGEIRDLEVGKIAVEAALTGHLVLSTLHTNDSASTITRLLNMGIESFLLTGSLNVVVAQRLCRKICESCKTEEKVDSAHLMKLGFPASSIGKIKVYRGKGCKKCNNRGYRGRIAIYEVLEVTQAIKELIHADASSDEIKLQAVKEGMKTLRMSALTKVATGETTIEEALSVSSADNFLKKAA